MLRLNIVPLHDMFCNLKPGSFTYRHAAFPHIANTQSRVVRGMNAAPSSKFSLWCGAVE